MKREQVIAFDRIQIVAWLSAAATVNNSFAAASAFALKRAWRRIQGL